MQGKQSSKTDETPRHDDSSWSSLDDNAKVFSFLFRLYPLAVVVVRRRNTILVTRTEGRKPEQPCPYILLQPQQKRSIPLVILLLVPVIIEERARRRSIGKEQTKRGGILFFGLFTNRVAGSFSKEPREVCRCPAIRHTQGQTFVAPHTQQQQQQTTVTTRNFQEGESLAKERERERERKPEQEKRGTPVNQSINNQPF